MTSEAIDRALKRVYAAQGHLGLNYKYAFKAVAEELENLEKQLRDAWLESLQAGR